MAEGTRTKSLEDSVHKSELQLQQINQFLASQNFMNSTQEFMDKPAELHPENVRAKSQSRAADERSGRGVLGSPPGARQASIFDQGEHSIASTGAQEILAKEPLSSKDSLSRSMKDCLHRMKVLTEQMNASFGQFKNDRQENQEETGDSRQQADTTASNSSAFSILGINYGEQDHGVLGSRPEEFNRNSSIKSHKVKQGISGSISVNSSQESNLSLNRIGDARQVFDGMSNVKNSEFSGMNHLSLKVTSNSIESVTIEIVESKRMGDSIDYNGIRLNDFRVTSFGFLDNSSVHNLFVEMPTRRVRCGSLFQQQTQLRDQSNRVFDPGDTDSECYGVKYVQMGMEKLRYGTSSLDAYGNSQILYSFDVVDIKSFTGLNGIACAVIFKFLRANEEPYLIPFEFLGTLENSVKTIKPNSFLIFDPGGRIELPLQTLVIIVFDPGIYEDEIASRIVVQKLGDRLQECGEMLHFDLQEIWTQTGGNGFSSTMQQMKVSYKRDHVVTDLIAQLLYEYSSQGIAPLIVHFIEPSWKQQVLIVSENDEAFKAFRKVMKGSQVRADMSNFDLLVEMLSLWVEKMLSLWAGNSIFDPGIPDISSLKCTAVISGKEFSWKMQKELIWVFDPGGNRTFLCC